MIFRFFKKGKELWERCPSCKEMIYKKELEENLFVCPKCSYHHRIGGRKRIEITFDPGTFEEWDLDLKPLDFLNFGEDYRRKLEENAQKVEANDAVITGKAKIGGYPVAVGVMDFSFRGGSMGSVVGEKITRMMERALEENLPVITFSASGGARMQEGILSLMQMAKTSAVVGLLKEKGLMYINVLTDPTTAGVAASFAGLADILIAEPGSLIGFTGARVIQQTIKEKLPEGFQTAEFSLEKGLIDMVVDRRKLRDTLISLLRAFYSSPLREKIYS